MFFRLKPAGERRYRQIVENKRDGRRTVQRVLATLGRLEDLEADGRLDTLLRSGARFCETAMLISTLRAGTLEGASSLRIGPPMVFGRLWEQAGCRAVIEQLAAGRNFGFPLERAIFVSVLPARNGWMAIRSMAPTVWSCISCIGRWPGWGKSWPIRAAPPGRGVASRISLRKRCFDAGAACSAICRWRCLIPRR